MDKITYQLSLVIERDQLSGRQVCIISLSVNCLESTWDFDGVAKIFQH